MWWQDYVTAGENNFNKYALTDIGVTFFSTKELYWTNQGVSYLQESLRLIWERDSEIRFWNDI